MIKNKMKKYLCIAWVILLLLAAFPLDNVYASSVKDFYSQREDLDPEFVESALQHFLELSAYRSAREEHFHYVRKWTNPIDLRVEGYPGTDGYRKLRDLEKRLNRIKGFPGISCAFDYVSPANAILRFDSRDKLNEVYFGDEENTLASYWYEWIWEPPYQIIEAVSGIAVDHEDAYEDHYPIAEMIFRMLGFDGEASGSTESLFQVDSPSIEPSELDIFALEMLYRPEIKPGMSIERAMEILRQLYLEHAKYDPSQDQKVAAELLTQAEREKEDLAVQENQDLWKSFGVKAQSKTKARTPFIELRDQIDPQFFELAIDYYAEVAGYGEYSSDFDGFVQKWEDSFAISLKGEVSEEFLEETKRLSVSLTSLGVPLTAFMITDEPQAITMRVDKHHVLESEIPDMAPNSDGFFTTYLRDGAISEAVIALCTDTTTQDSLKHALYEETIQSLGVSNDSYRYMDSIFQQQYTHVTYPSELDWLLVEMHYRPEIKSGMSVDEACEILRELYLGK